MIQKEKVTIVKAGGRVLDSEAELNKLLKEFDSIDGKKILVHGGGVFINELCEKLDIETQMVNGRRITSKENMDVVLMACAGKLNKELVSGLNKLGMNAVGFCGGDLNIIQSRKRSPHPIDFGMVGDIEKINTEWLQIFLDKGVVPVMSSISQSGSFELLNTNADTVASSMAAALAKIYDVELFFYFDKNGVLEDADNNDSLISILGLNTFLTMKQAKSIHTGMLPKLDNGFLALKGGVADVKLGNSMGQGTKLIIED
ncbi:MAG: acetylglutamate kinase [Salinivirgaceae bacterium]|jgi:acetylglutamate kinase|nr:acetylglutamate kinase [Salinivirgaceae bacterium]